MDELILRSDAVASAQAEGRPVVALESTIITHGMPYPQNLEDRARGLRTRFGRPVRRPRRSPSSRGGCAVGLSDDGLEALARRAACANSAARISRVCLASGETGGDHGGGDDDRGASGRDRRLRHGRDRRRCIAAPRKASTISADLRELAQTPVTVVAAGAKAILDLPKTAGGARDARRAGDRRGPGRVSGLLVARQRASRTPSGSTRPGRSPRPTGCGGRLGFAGRAAGGQPDPGGGRDCVRDACPADRRGAGPGDGTGRHRQGCDAVPAANGFSSAPRAERF